MNIRTKLVPVTWLDKIPHGYGCGYIGVPPEHPWFGKDYSMTWDELSPNAHGGITWCNNHIPKQDDCKESSDIWWIGFDTCHSTDTIHNCSKEYCENEIESLKQQAINAIK